MRKQFLRTVSDLAAKDDRIIVIVGDFSHHIFSDFEKKYPGRFYNMGICENTLISATAGLSSQGFFPFVHAIAPFLTERSLEQIKLDLCYNQFGGNIVSGGASFDYAWDGPTHHCYTDLAILRLIPNIEVLQPGSLKEVDTLIRSQYNNGKTTYFRLSENTHGLDFTVEFGKGTVLKNESDDLTVMTAGPILGNVFEACKDLPVNLVYFSTIKPIDKEIIKKFSHTKIIVIHDAFGLYEAICEIPDISVSYHGLTDKFCTCYGKIQDVRKNLGLDIDSIREFILTYLNKTKK
jgi:transketolase